MYVCLRCASTWVGGWVRLLCRALLSAFLSLSLPCCSAYQHNTRIHRLTPLCMQSIIRCLGCKTMSRSVDPIEDLVLEIQDNGRCVRRMRRRGRVGGRDGNLYVVGTKARDM